MKRIRSGLFKFLSFIIINTIVMTLFVPFKQILAASSIQMSLSTDDTRTSFSAGDTITFNLKIDTIDSAVSTIQGYLNFNSSLLELGYDDDAGLYNILGTRVWSDAEYDSTQKSILLSTTTSNGSDRTGTIQTIEFKLKRAASISDIAILIDDITASGGQGDLREVDDVEYGDVTSLRNSGTGGEETADVQFSLTTDSSATSFNAGDIITLKLNLDQTNAAMTTVEGYLDFDNTLLEITYDDEYDLYNIMSPNRVWSDAEYNEETGLLRLNTTNSSTGSSATGTIQTIEFKVLRATDALQVEFNDITVSGGQGDLREGSCTAYSVGNLNVTKHTVTYNYTQNGGTKASSTAEVAEGAAIDLTLTDDTRTDGYTFVGWNTNSSSHTALTSTDSNATMGTSNVTLYAIYKKELTMGFNSYQGIVKTRTTQKTYVYNNETQTDSVTFPTASNLTKDGGSWVHVGWTTSQTATTAETQERESKTLAPANTEFYMIYSKTITISYVLNGGTGTAPTADSGSILVNSNNALTNITGYTTTIASTTATKEGYSFNGWNTAANGSGTSYTAGTSQQFTESTTLNAQWTPRNDTIYYIEYYKQNGNTLEYELDSSATETKTGTTGTTATVTVDSNKYGTGYDYDSSNSVIRGTITAGTGNELVLKVYYNVKGDRTYKVERWVEDGQNPGSYELKHTDTYTNGITGVTVTAPTAQTDYPGYTEHLEGSEASGEVRADNNDPLILKVYYTANTDTKYYVEYYKQNWDGSWPTTTDDVETRQGRTGSSVDITSETKKSIQGYTHDSTESRNSFTGIIAGNESLRLKVYYTANTNTAYKIEHYLQAANGNYLLTTSETENLTGTTGAPVTATAKTSILNNGYVEDTTNSSRVESGNIEPDGQLTLKVYYKRLLTITLDNNDGTSTQTNFQVPYGDTYGDNLTTLTRNGYQHNGWSTTRDDGSTRVDSSTQVTTSHTLYALWGTDSYTVTFDVQGGNSVESITVEYGSTYGELPTTTKEGYQFGGWYTNSSYNQKVESTDTVQQGNHTLVAKWIPVPTVFFDTCSDGAVTANPSSQEVVLGEAYGTLPTLTGTKVGYDFVGWFTEENGGTQVEATTIVTNAEHHTLYAHWSAADYTVTFDKNTIFNVSINPSSKVVTFDQPYGTLPDLSNQLEGHTFLGWYKEADCINKVESTTIVNTGENHTLYAKWDANEITVTLKYRTNDGTPEGGWSQIEAEFHYGDAINAQTLAEHGIVLDNYSNDVVTPKYTYTVNTPKFTGTTPSRLTSDREIVVNYNEPIINKYTVKFYNWDGTYLTEESIDYGQNASGLSAEQQAVRDDVTNNYVFSNWVKADRQTDATSDLTNVIENRSVYASFTATLKDYKIKFLDENGTTVLSNKEDYHYGDIIQVPQEPTKAATAQYSYRFSHWVDEDGQSITSADLATRTVAGDQTYTASYANITNKYTVTFYNEAGDQILDTDTVDYGQSALWNRNNDKETPEKVDVSTGYTYEFEKWVKEDRETEDTLADVVENRNVYASFKAIPIVYNIYYENLMGSNNTNPTTYTVDDNDIVLRELPDMPGLKFSAWCLDEQCINEISTLETSTKSDVRIYAKWEIEDLMYFVKESVDINNDSSSVIICEKFEQAKEYVDSLFNNGRGRALGIYDLNNDLIYLPKALYYVKETESIDNSLAMHFTDFEEAKEYVDVLFEQGTTIRIYDANNELVYEPKEEPEPVEVTTVKYFVKVNSSDENTDQNTFDVFSDAKRKADELKATDVKVYDVNGEVVYDPNDKIEVEPQPDPQPNPQPDQEEALYLKSQKYRIGENNIHQYEDNDIFLYRINPYTKLSEFISECETNGTISVYNQSGERLGNDEFIGTGMTLRDEKNGKYIILTLSVKGDLSGDGEITATDMSDLSQAILKEVKLKGVKLLAADISDDKKVTATDMSDLAQAILKELDLSTIN